MPHRFPSRADGQCLKIRTFSYSSAPRLSKTLERNPIRIVVDRLAPDGTLQQDILIDQTIQRVKILPNPQPQLTPRLPPPPPLAHQSKPSHFQRYSYQNYEHPWLGKTLQHSPPKRKMHGTKTLEVVFCETRLPDFVRYTNAKFAAQFEEQQQKERSPRIQKAPVREGKKQIPRRGKTTLANYLQEFTTLEKLSLFLQREQRLGEQCLCQPQDQGDASRTVLLDIITHRFAFLKRLPKKIRQSLYRSLLRRNQLSPLSRINIHEYLKFAAVFLGRDAPPSQLSSFLYSFLFRGQHQSLSCVSTVLDQLNGSEMKRRQILAELEFILQEKDIMNALSANPRFLSLCIDFILQK